MHQNLSGLYAFAIVRSETAFAEAVHRRAWIASSPFAPATAQVGLGQRRSMNCRRFEDGRTLGGRRGFRAWECEKKLRQGPIISGAKFF
jgi:hypothetical protein